MGYLKTGQWSAEDAETASRMWKAGDSAGAIAAVVGRERSAVLGFAHRNRAKFPPKSGSTHSARVAPAGAGRSGGDRTVRRAIEAVRMATSGEGITAPDASDLIDDLKVFRGADRPRPGVARSISCQAVALIAPQEEITRAVRSGTLPEDAEPVSFGHVGECQCRWPVDMSVSEHGPAADKACGAPVLDSSSRIGMARTHCGFHFRAAGQDVGKVLG